MSHLTPDETKHSRNPELIDALLDNNISNENYEITFEKQSPNSVTGTFIHKNSGETYKSAFGLPSEHNGLIVKAEQNFQIEPPVESEPIIVWGFKRGQWIPYHPDFEIQASDFIDFLSNFLIAVHDNRNIDEDNNPVPTGDTHIDDLPID